MATVGSVVVRYATDTTEYTKGVEKAKKANQGFLKDLKESFGKSSTLGQSLKVLAGSGAIFALGKISSEFNALTKKAEDFAVALNKSDGSAREFAADLLKSIPIAGQLGEGLARVYSIVSGEAQYVASLKEETEIQDKLTKVMIDRGAAMQKYRKEVQETIANIRADIQELRLEGLPLEVFKINRETQDKIKKAGEDAKKAAGIDPESQALLQQYSKKVNDASIALGDAQENAGSLLAREDDAETIKAAQDSLNLWKSKRQALLNQITKEQKEAEQKASQVIGMERAKGEWAKWKASTDAFQKGYQEFKKNFLDTYDDAKKAQDKKQKEQRDAAKKHAEEIGKASTDAWKKTVENVTKTVEKFREQSAKMAEDVRTPLEKLKDTMNDINLRAILPASLGGLNFETIRRLRQKAQEEFDKDTRITPASVDVRRSGMFAPGATNPIAKKIDTSNKHLSDISDAVAAIKSNPALLLYAIPGLP